MASRSLAIGKKDVAVVVPHCRDLVVFFWCYTPPNDGEFNIAALKGRAKKKKKRLDKVCERDGERRRGRRDGRRETEREKDGRMVFVTQ